MTGLVVRKLFAGFLSPLLLLGSSFAPCASLSVQAAVVNNSSFKFIKENAAAGLKEYRLNSNGLKVLLQEKHNSPVVTVMVVFKVGSRNEAVGYTGSTHFLEHMMFKGTAKHDPLKGTGLDDLLKPIGGLNNATTSYDRTNYYEVVPSKNLELCLEVEADRMRNALLRSSDRESEMTVVRNELERDENMAEDILTNQTFATAFREHPYHHPVIGWRSDVEGVPIERLRQFYRDFYFPDNATLFICGDFKTADALNYISKHFSKVPKSPRPFPKVYTTEPPQEGERRFTVQRGDEMPKLMMAFHIPNAMSKDAYPLEVLAAILGDQKRQSSRLYKQLVDSGLASETYASNYSMKDPGLFFLYASATNGTKLDTIEKKIEDEMESLGKEPISAAELERAKMSVWKKAKLEADDPMHFAQQIADAESVADWEWWINLEKNIKAVTAADLQRVAKKYFSQSNRTVGFYLPKESPKDEKASSSSSQLAVLPGTAIIPVLISAPDSKTSKLEIPKLAAATSASTQVAAAAAASASSAAAASVAGGSSVGQGMIASKTKKKVLANGLTVYTMPMRGSGIVAISAKLRGGETMSSPDKTLVPDLLGDMLNKGSKAMSKEQLADTLETMGSSLDVDVSTFWAELDSKVVKEDLDKYMALMSESLYNPLLEKDELDKLKKQTEANLKDAMVDTELLADNKMVGTLYKPGCVYYDRPYSEQLEELKTITIEDLKELHKRQFVASNMCMAIVGDLSAEEAFSLAEKHFGSWEKGSPADISLKTCEAKPQGGRILLSQIPDKSSVDIVMACPANVSIFSKDFCAAQLANSALGHDTISSRLAVVREKHGLTYGISSSFAENAEPWSPWEIQLTVNPSNTNKALKLVRGIVSEYAAKGMTADELQMEKQRMAGEYVVHRMRTPGHLAESLTKYGTLGLGAEFMDRYPTMLQNVSLKEANVAIGKYMKPENLCTSLAGSIPADVKAK